MAVATLPAIDLRAQATGAATVSYVCRNDSSRRRLPRTAYVRFDGTRAWLAANPVVCAYRKHHSVSAHGSEDCTAQSPGHGKERRNRRSSSAAIGGGRGDCCHQWPESRTAAQVARSICEGEGYAVLAAGDIASDEGVDRVASAAREALGGWTSSSTMWAGPRPRRTLENLGSRSTLTTAWRLTTNASWPVSASRSFWFRR